MEIEFISKKELQRLFNKTYLARIQAGELTESVVYDETPNPSYNQPTGTRSQRVVYSESDGREVAEAHRYVLPDGSIGASGKPDPTQVKIKGVIYSIPPAPERRKRFRLLRY